MVRQSRNAYRCNQVPAHGQQSIGTMVSNLCWDCLFHLNRAPPNHRGQPHTGMGNPVARPLRPIYRTSQMFRSGLLRGGHRRGQFCLCKQSGAIPILMLWTAQILFGAGGLRHCQPTEPHHPPWTKFVRLRHRNRRVPGCRRC